MSGLELFARGKRPASREVLAAARAARATGRPLTWHLAPSNVELLAGFAAEVPRARLPMITVVLRAIDEAPDRTVVADEAALVPEVRRLHGRGAALRLSTGRAYVLPPPAVDISTNDLCGLECVMCKNRAPRRDPRTMSPGDVRALLAEVAGWGVQRVALTGAGEPFRDPEMLGHVREANRLGLRVNITTNGFPMSEDVARELATRDVSVSVSIHGATPATHDAIVGVPKASANAFRAVKRMVAARDAAPSRLAVNVSTVVQRANVGEIAALARWAREQGCDAFNIQPVNLQHGAVSGDRIVRRDDVQLLATLWPTRAEAPALDRMVEELSELRRLHPRFLNTSAERLTLFRSYFEDSSRAALGVTCHVGETFLGIDHRGAVKPCYRLGWNLGDARLTSVRALWNSQVYADRRAMIERCPLTCMNNCFFRPTRRDLDADRGPS